MSKQMIGRMVVVISLTALLAGCSNEGKLSSNRAMTGGLWTVAIHSSAFKQQETIPAKYTQDGQNISPPLNWSRGPSGVKEWVLVVEDADAKGDFPPIQWFVYRIPGETTQLAEGASTTAGLMQGKNHLGQMGYAGPATQKGKPHRYFFQIFALDTPQKFPPGMVRGDAAKIFEGHILAKGQLIGKYPAPPVAK